MDGNELDSVPNVCSHFSSNLSHRFQAGVFSDPRSGIMQGTPFTTGYSPLLDRNAMTSSSLRITVKAAELSIGQARYRNKKSR
jgi:hypothetical protein